MNEHNCLIRPKKSMCTETMWFIHHFTIVLRENHKKSTLVKKKLNKKNLFFYSRCCFTLRYENWMKFKRICTSISLLLSLSIHFIIISWCYSVSFDGAPCNLSWVTEWCIKLFQFNLNKVNIRGKTSVFLSSHKPY